MTIQTQGWVGISRGFVDKILKIGYKQKKTHGGVCRVAPATKK